MKKIINYTYKTLLYSTTTLLLLTTLLAMIIPENNSLITIGKSCAEYGTYFLVFSLSIKSLSLLIPKDYLLGQFCKLHLPYQKEQGLIIFNLFAIHTIINIFDYLSNFSLLIFMILTAIIPTIVLIFLELTSFRKFQFRSWKKTHSIVWMILPLTTLHVYLLDIEIKKYLLLNAIIILIIILEIFFRPKRAKVHSFYLVISIILTIIQGFIFLTFYTFENAASTGEDTIILNQEQLDSTIEDSTLGDDTAVVNDQADEENTDEQSTDTIVPSIYSDGVYTGSGYGFKSEIIVETTIENDVITKVEIIAENDDEPFSQLPIASIPDEIVSANSTDVDVVSGSTYTSQGIIDAVNDCLEQAKN